MKRVEKPWGYELIFAQTEVYVGKILHVNRGEMLSLQYHEVKDETIYLSSGLLGLEVGESEARLKHIEMKVGDYLHIPPGMRHRMIAIEECDIFEVSTPELDDVVRLEDKYGRVKPAG